MTTKRDVCDFELFAPKPTDPCWQIDTDQMPEPLNDGNWEIALAFRLRDVAAANPSGELACFTHAEMSMDFGHPGLSVWLVCSGSPAIIQAAKQAVTETIHATFRRNAILPPGAEWQARMRIAEGQVWEPEDAATWVSIFDPSETDVPSEAQTREVTQAIAEFNEALGDEATAEDETQEQGDEKFEPIPLLPRRRNGGIRQRFQSNVTLGYYQAKLERLGGMPEGSIRFLNPDGSLAHPSQLVRTLRGRYEGSSD